MWTLFRPPFAMQTFVVLLYELRATGSGLAAGSSKLGGLIGGVGSVTGLLVVST
jgi:hypothetical protein